MLAFQPAAVRPVMGRAVARPLGAAVPPPGPDPIFTGYTGVPGFIEAALVLTITGAAAWAGISLGMMEEHARSLRAAGWVGGVGSALAGLLYIGAKSGYAPSWLPAVRVTPS